MIGSCRICGNSKLKTIMDLGEQALSCRFPSKNDVEPPVYPLILVKCDDYNNENCGLVQLSQNTPSDELYEHTYGYRSGLNESMILHLTSLSKECLNRVTLDEDDIILDIGSNDCTFLHSYKDIPNGVSKIGIDPTGNQFKQYYTDDVTLISDYFTKELFINKYEDKKAKIITSICMFYDLPDPLKFAEDIKSILHPNGIWVTEQSYIISMLEANSFDTICHEHLEYYSFKQLEYIASKVGLKILDVSTNSSNGGSFRVTFGHSDSSLKENISNIDKLKDYERTYNLDTDFPYNQFKNNCEENKKRLLKFLHDFKKTGKNIYIYGASTKGGVLLQYFNIDNTLITAAAERNPQKYGKIIAGTNIPIISEIEMRNANPDLMLVLPWHFRDSFINREKEYIENGGQFIFPLPKMEIYTSKRKAFVTGINGQIGSYLSELLLEKDYIVYGLLHKNITSLNPKINYIFGDLEDSDSIKNLIKDISPDEVYNLAGETDTMSSIQKPEHTFDINARIVINICEAIKEMKDKNIKFFQANSSEIYKGSLSEEGTVVNEKSMNFYPITPYSIAKLSSYWMIRYYREKYNMHFSNGIIFSTESSRRDSKYLTKKVTNYVKSLPNEETLNLGNLNCCRDWVHAEDVAKAIYLIIQQDRGDDYIISSGSSTSVKRFIELVFSKKGIKLLWDENHASDSLTNKIYIKLNPELIRKFEKNENLVGDNSKLKSIGWIAQYTLNDIIDEMI